MEPPYMTIARATATLSLLVSILFLIVARRYRVDAIGVFLAPISLTALLAARVSEWRMLSNVAAFDHALSGYFTVLLAIHVSAIVLSATCFSVAAAVAATYLILNARMKQKSLSLRGHPPSLAALDRVGALCVLIGFPLLTIGIVTGLAWTGTESASSHASLIRQAATYLSWMLFGLALVLRRAFGYRGTRAHWLVILGYVSSLAVFAYYFYRSAQ
jgi:ABC-type uncharacterized transport system permease subunit